MHDITYPRFLALCDIAPSEFQERETGLIEWYNDLGISPAGVFLLTSPYGLGLSRQERAALPQHPTGDYSEPILRFPASLSAVLAMLEEHGLEDCVEPAVIASIPADYCPDTTGLVAWHAVILEAWPNITKAHGPKPKARKVLSWVKAYGPHDTIPSEQPDRDALHWLDRDGNLQTTPIKTLSTLLSKWRKVGTIPT